MRNRKLWECACTTCNLVVHKSVVRSWVEIVMCSFSINLTSSESIYFFWFSSCLQVSVDKCQPHINSPVCYRSTFHHGNTILIRAYAKSSSNVSQTLQSICYQMHALLPVIRQHLSFFMNWKLVNFTKLPLKLCVIEINKQYGSIYTGTKYDYHFAI